jgi:streptogramin lyase
LVGGPFSPSDIAVGSDKNLWFTETNAIGKITTSGEVTEYELPSGGEPRGITAGPDGNLWFANHGTFNHAVGKITTSGAITEYPLPDAPYGITAGPDGNLWFTEPFSGKVGKITTSGTITEYSPGNVGSSGIASGPDGSLWVTQSHQVAKVTTSGVFTVYPLPNEAAAEDIAPGPEGDLWVTEDPVRGGCACSANENSVVKITPGGVITEYKLPYQTEPVGIAQGPDSDMWFVGGTGNGPGLITKIVP